MELSLDLLPACVLPWDDLEKPVGLITTMAGTVGTELPLPVDRVCCPTARPWWLEPPMVALVGQRLGLQMVVLWLPVESSSWQCCARSSLERARCALFLQLLQ